MSRDAYCRPAIELGGSRDGQLTVRLIELIDSWQAYLELCRLSSRPEADAERRHSRSRGANRAQTDAYGSRHRVVVSTGGAVAMGICAFFWIATAWPEGAGAIAFAAVSCTLFASLDDPTPTIRNIALLLALCIPIVFVYQFFVLPAITGFVLLCVVLAFVLIPGRHLDGDSGLCRIGLALALGFCVEMSLQTSYTADLAASSIPTALLCSAALRRWL